MGAGTNSDALRNTCLKIYGSNNMTTAMNGTWYNLNTHVNTVGSAGGSPDNIGWCWVVAADACKTYSESSGVGVQGWVFRASSNVANYKYYKLQCVGGTGWDSNYELGGVTLDYKKYYELDYV